MSIADFHIKYDCNVFIGYSPLRKLLDAKKTQDKMRYVNSPNSYQRVQVLETGTTDPRKITKVQ